MSTPRWTRETLTEIKREYTETTPYGPYHVKEVRRLERVAGRYLEVHVWKNGVCTHSFQDGNLERIQSYCERYGFKW